MRSSWILAAAILIIACQPAPPAAEVTLYVRNLADDAAIVAVQPDTDPPTAMGFGAAGTATALGGGCVKVPVGAAVVLIDDDDPDGPALERIFTVTGADVVAGRTAWVEITPQGVRTGEGQPGWWVGDTQAC